MKSGLMTSSIHSMRSKIAAARYIEPDSPLSTQALITKLYKVLSSFALFLWAQESELYVSSTSQSSFSALCANPGFSALLSAKSRISSFNFMRCDFRGIIRSFAFCRRELEVKPIFEFVPFWKLGKTFRKLGASSLLLINKPSPNTSVVLSEHGCCTEAQNRDETIAVRLRFVNISQKMEDLAPSLSDLKGIKSKSKTGSIFLIAV
mmetsp:Transcript_50903/g.75446  ORF Transcript_50903/g.75446 Transcript_50903/m.75446 type:complete len:206 (-) Transcript_50903:176-793(-)